MLLYLTSPIELSHFAAVDFVCDEPRIRAISFVGSDRVGRYIYERGTANGKRVQSNMVRKGLLLPLQLNLVCLF